LCFQYTAQMPILREFFLYAVQRGATALNKLLVDHVKAELQVKTNFNLTCEEFYNMPIKNKKLLEAVKSNT
jgi:hypothetical protein